MPEILEKSFKDKKGPIAQLFVKISVKNCCFSSNMQTFSSKFQNHFGRFSTENFEISIASTLPKKWKNMVTGLKYNILKISATTYLYNCNSAFLK